MITNMMKGKTINDYTMRYLLEKGSMAEVWYAENHEGKCVAIKVLNEEYARQYKIIRRFKNKARVTTRLEHHNIRKVIQCTEIDRRPIIIMEYLEGMPLSEYIKRNLSYSDDVLVKWWNQIIDALTYSHQCGIIHGDIKPSNLFVTVQGDIKLLNFSGSTGWGESGLLRNEHAIDSLLYMSPEQVFDCTNVDERTDAYSLAVTFVQILNRNYPYKLTNTASYNEVKERIVSQQVDTSFLPNNWSAFLRDFLQKDRDRRGSLKQILLNSKADNDSSVDIKCHQKQTKKVDKVEEGDSVKKDNNLSKIGLWVASVIGLLAIGFLLYIQSGHEVVKDALVQDKPIVDVPSQTKHEDVQPVSTYEKNRNISVGTAEVLFNKFQQDNIHTNLREMGKLFADKILVFHSLSNLTFSEAAPGILKYHKR